MPKAGETLAHLATKSSSLAGPISLRSVLLLSAAALALSVAFFAPHLWLLRSPAPGSWEWTRALEYLQQCRDPWSSHVGSAMRWRFLPQLLAYGLRLGPSACLCLPWCGVAALTAVCARLLLQQTANSPVTTLAGLVVVTTTAPILCCTGWLGINDAWFVLGLMALAFSSGRILPVAALLLAPWVDERFWFGLPSALMIRWLIDARRFGPCDVLLFLVAAVPTVAIRLAGLRHGSADSSVVFIQEIRSQIGTLVSQSRLGFWMGLRWAILPIVLAWEAIGRSRGGRVGLLAAASLVLPLIAVSGLAADSMRTSGIALPWIVYGLIELARRPDGARWLLGLALLQLATPAAQVTGGEIGLIDPLPIELYRIFLRH